LVAALVGAATGGLVAAVVAAGEEDSGTASQSRHQDAPVELTESVAAIADRGLPAVVTIDVSVGSDSGTGSGVIIRPDGHILTNNHVVAPAADGGGRVTVSLYKQLRQIPARIVGRDPKTDLAVIKVDVSEQLHAAALGRSGSLVVGAPVVAIGAPLGLSGTVTTVSSVPSTATRRYGGGRPHLGVDRGDPDRRRHQSRQLRWCLTRRPWPGRRHQHRNRGDSRHR
jgi:putative serine protease PepD